MEQKRSYCGADLDVSEVAVSLLELVDWARFTSLASIILNDGIEPFQRTSVLLNHVSSTKWADHDGGPSDFDQWRTEMWRLRAELVEMIDGWCFAADFVADRERAVGVPRASEN